MAFTNAATPDWTGHACTWKLELHTVLSATLTDEEFLNGQTHGREAALGAVLRLPAPSGRAPAVILLHGSAGVSGHVDDWARYLNELGVAAFMVDSFTGRGIDMTLADQRQLGRTAMIVDAYRALDSLARHPRIDPDRIALLGFSRGGQAALYAAVERFQQLHASKLTRFAAHLAFYPSCHTRFIDDERVTSSPIHVLHGTADSFNSIEFTREYAARVQAAGGHITLHEFEGADHVFDWALLRQPMSLPGVRSNLHARYEEQAVGRLVRIDVSGVTTEPRFAYDANASNAARQIVARVVRDLVTGAAQ